MGWSGVRAIAFVAAATTLGAGQAKDVDVGVVLARVARAVERYYERAQSVICLETVTLQPLGWDLLGDGTTHRRLSYELRVGWDPPSDGARLQATVLRQLLTVNGRPPGPKDEPGCMDPKAVSPEPLAMLLPRGQQDFVFTSAGRRRVRGRPAVALDYKSRTVGPATVTWKEDCFSIDLPGRVHGRVWIDPDSGNVLRLDERLSGRFDYTLPRERQRAGGPSSITVERHESSIVYRPVTFRDPEETLMLPASIDTVSIVRNAGVPRLRTSQVFSNYQRFTTKGRVVQ